MDNCRYAGKGIGIYDGPVSKKQRRQFDVLRDGAPNKADPYYLILDYNYATLTTTDPNLTYSQMRFNLRQPIKGYSKCSLVHAYMNNYQSFSANSIFGFFGIAINEIAGNMDLATNSNIFNNLYGSVSNPPPRANPTFMVPRTFAYTGPNITATSSPDYNAIFFSESSLNQFHADVSGLVLTQLNVQLTSENFFQNYAGTAPTNFEFRALLRFYNDEYE